MQWQGKLGMCAVVMGAVMAVACGQPEELGSEETRAGTGLGQRAAALGSWAHFDSALRAPRCTGESSGCDTLNLVRGRGSVGPERSAPNTLGGSCTDGTSGVYHSDESLEQVSVYNAEGLTLTEGRPVAISVEVWAGANYKSDVLDLYYTSDATQPTWTLLTSLRPTGAGAQTLRTSYTLPSGMGTQAVRAVFRRGGFAGPCVPGAYADRDDLAFDVGPRFPLSLSSRLAGGYGFSLQLRQDSTVWAYGYDSVGQLGDGAPSVFQPSPVPVPGLAQMRAVAAGGEHSLALKSDSTVWSWGYNDAGQLGDGTTTSRSTPGQVLGLDGVVAIAAGDHHSLALRQDGTVWAWGENYHGQLGDGTTTPSAVPVQVTGLSEVIAISAGGYHSVALKSDGTVWGWGYNVVGQLGDGGALWRQPTPVQAQGLFGVSAIATGWAHTLALKPDGSVWAWGANYDGEMGDGTTAAHYTPAQVPHLTEVVALGSSHDAFSAVVRVDGTVWAWGENFSGELGDGTTTQRLTPVQVPGFNGAVALSGGGFHTLALKQDGSVWGWGGGGYSELGDGGNDFQVLTPVQAPGVISVQ